MAQNESSRKKALVIGINAYKHKPLKNSVSDANIMASTLKSIGFDVTKEVNLTHDAMEQVLLKFKQKIKPKDMVVFYFSGHGIQWENENFVIPKEDVNSGDDTIQKAIFSLDQMTNLAEENGIINLAAVKRCMVHVQGIVNDFGIMSPFVTIVLLDCCRVYWFRNPILRKLTSREPISSSREPPLRTSEYHSSIQNDSAGWLIGFACAPGAVADDNDIDIYGLYTKYLVKYIVNPSWSISRVLNAVAAAVKLESKSQQQPEYRSGICSDEEICLYGQVPTHSAQQKRVIPNLPVNATWEQQGETVAGGNGLGGNNNQLCHPFGLFVDDDDDQTIVIADTGNHRIMQWKRNDTEGQVVAGGNDKGNRLDQLNNPSDVLIDKETNSLLIADGWKNKRVVRWSRRSSATEGEILIDNIYCYGLAIDEQRNLYVSDFRKDEVRRYEIDRGDKTGTVVAGGNGKGSGLNKLDYPRFLFVDRTQSLYVSDNENHRVMKWDKDAAQGVVVAGRQRYGSALTQLSYPNGIFVDTLCTLYVAEGGNERVTCWPQGSERKGTVVVGGNGEGSAANQFTDPDGLSFDKYGNLYVVDNFNHRVQRFNRTQ